VTPAGRSSLGEQYAAAAHAVAAVLSGESLTAVRETALAPLRDPRARAGAQAFLYATLRAYGPAPALVRLLLRRPLTDTVLAALLYVALTDLRANPAHAHTVVDQAVHAAVSLGRIAGKGLVNAVLRNYLRHRASLEQRIGADPEVAWQHPRWWVDRVREEWPDAWQGVLAAANEPPPLCIRVNARAGNAAAYAARLAEVGLAGRPAGAEALIVEPPVGVESLPGFHEGACSVQDAGAQRAAHLLEVADGQRVLDACAAPGGKAAHILERARVDLLALELDAARAPLIEENLARLRLHGQVRVGDAADPQEWWDGRPFDRILADVPCTASGIARRHPDLKWLRRKSDIAQFARSQRAIVRALWPLLAPGGKFLYATCSVFQEENQHVRDAVAAELPDALQIRLPGLRDGQLLPAADHDGFYYAMLEKKRTG